MTKPLNLSVDRSAKTTLAERIRHGIATAIESGVLEMSNRGWLRTLVEWHQQE